MKPQEPIPHNYSIATLNKIFAISSLVLLFVTGIIVVYDYARGWKRFQIGFMKLERERVEQELEAARAAADRGELTRLDKLVSEREKEIAGRRGDYRRAQERLQTWEGRHYAADQNYRFAKAVLDALRYEAEVAREQKARDADARAHAYEEKAEEVERLKLVLEDVNRSRAAAKAEVDRFEKLIAEVQDQKAELTGDIERLEKRLASVSTNADFLILNAPLLDFVSPTLKVDQIVVQDMFIDMNYLHVPRVDRCTTCHRAIDRPGFESKKEAARLQAELEQKIENFEIPAERVEETRQRIEALKRLQQVKGIANPYRTHPFLDTFVGSASAHPMADFGCTGCHRGQDRATNFARAGHTPMSGRQRARWTQQWHWKAQKYLETPMYPRQYFQASCMKCHGNEVVIDRGPAISRGTQMVELYGCHACHKINNWRFSDLRKPGPSLRGIAEKTTPDWVVRWLSDPHAFRPTTRMPAFFYQDNMTGPHVEPEERAHNAQLQNAEIHAIATYLFNKSTRRQWVGSGGGDAARGKALVESVGCFGCHIAQDTIQDAEGKTRTARRDDFPLERHYGFNLVGTGTKSDPDWLFNWLKNPKNYYHDAPMPDLRLSDEEAADIVTYLMSLQKPEFMRKPIPAPARAAVAELTKSYLINTMTDADARARLARMSDQEQLTYLGQRTIEKYGCYSCHDIEGFDGLKPIGTELTTEGSKTLHLFDFGFVHQYEAHDGAKERVQHTVPSWIYTKVRSPRVWDQEREKTYHDKLKMPNFKLSKAEAEAVTAVVLGLTKERVNPNKLASSDPRSRTAQEGMKAISQHNCRGCHIVGGTGRAIAQTISDPGMLPPDLTPQGARVQSAWLFNFLKDPTVMPLRPWLAVRMPTFHFDDRETNTIVNGFAAEGNVLAYDTTRDRNPHPRSVAIGGTLFEMLRCAQCHPSAPPAPGQVTDAASLAPNLTFSRVRLQHEWIPDWIRRPNEIIPGTRMPTNFPRDQKTGHFTSPLVQGIDAPNFAAYRAALVAQFGSEEAMRKGLQDVEMTTGYLRDYIWSIGSTTMRTPQPELTFETPRQQSLPPQQPPPPAAPAGTLGAAAGGAR